MSTPHMRGRETPPVDRTETASGGKPGAGSNAGSSGLGFFFRMSLPYSGWMLLGLFLACATFASGLGLGAVSGAFLTATAIAGLSIGTAQGFNVFIPSAGIRFFSISRTASRWLERVVTHDATFRIIGRLRVWLYGKLSRLSPRQLGGVHAADVLNRLTRDIDLLDNLYLRLLLPTIAAIIALGLLAGFVGGIALVLTWPLLAILVCAVAIVPVFAFRSGFDLSRDLIADQNQLRIALLDAVDGIDDLALHRPAWDGIRNKIADIDDERLSRQLRFQRRGAIFRSALVLLTGLAVWALIWIAATVPGASIGGPTLVALVMLVMGTIEVIQGLPRAWLELAGTIAAAARVSALAGQEPSPKFAEEPDGRREAMAASVVKTDQNSNNRNSTVQNNSGHPAFDIKVSDLSFAYHPENPVLSEINLDVPEGTHLAICGPSGGGKSTLAALLARMEQAPQGTINLGGREPDSFDEESFRNLVAANTQDPWIFTASVAANLRLAAPEACDAQVLEVLSLAGLRDQVSSWPEGLETWIEEGGASLSGGERRRLAAARVLLRGCPVTILDEPTEGLDDAAANALVAAVRERLKGKTLLWISHRPHGIAEFDRVVVVENGKLREY